MIMMDAIVEGSGNFEHLAFFNMPLYHIVHGPLAFWLHRNETAAAEIVPATFGSAAKHRNRCNTTSDAFQGLFYTEIFNYTTFFMYLCAQYILYFYFSLKTANCKVTVSRSL